MIDRHMRGRRNSRASCGIIGARLSLVTGLALAVLGWNDTCALADKIKHPVAVFSGLDKITGRIISFEVAIDETVQFGSLQITERVCFTRPATETPQTTTFIEVDEVDAKNDYKRIFSGWMFAASPGLHGIEHPVYDIWLTDCKGGTEIIPSAPETAEAEPAVPENAKSAPKPGTQRARRPVPNPNDESFGEPLPGSAPSRNGPIVVGPPPGFSAPAERRAPTQRFYPTNPAPSYPGAGRDPTGNGGL